MSPTVVHSKVCSLCTLAVSSFHIKHVQVAYWHIFCTVKLKHPSEVKHIAKHIFEWRETSVKFSMQDFYF